MIMYRGLRKFIRLSLAIVAMIVFVSLSYASSAPVSDSFSSKDIITVLFGLLQTIFMGIGVWLIANDKELFTRVATMEKKQAVQEMKCEERWDNGNHPSRRVGDGKS